jgi:hypothetical protein
MFYIRENPIYLYIIYIYLELDIQHSVVYDHNELINEYFAVVKTILNI